VQPRDLDPGLHAQRGVRFDNAREQEDLGLAHDRAPIATRCRCHPRDRVLALQQLVEVQDARGLLDAARDSASAAYGAQAEGMFLHRHVRVERVALEHHRTLRRDGGKS